MQGIKSGMIMQRNCQNVCEIYVKADKITAVTYCSESACGECVVENTEKGWKISGIPAGGPYTVTVDGERFDNILVGDIYLLAGQSNMEGFGWIAEGDREEAGVDFCRSFYQKGEWAVAKHPLHDIYNDPYGAHTSIGIPRQEDFFKGIGPGVSFARKLYELTGVPQGVIPCAHGGTALSQWQKSEKGPDESLYAAMYERFLECGGNAAGMFWYQGCDDAFRGIGDIYFDEYSRFADIFFADFGKLPILTVQIGRVIVEENKALRDHWQMVQDAQRKIAQKYDNIYLLSSVSAELDDQIHLSRKEQLCLGEIAARAMFAIKNPDNTLGAKPPIELEKIEVKRDSVTEKAFIYVTYKNVEGELSADGRATGYFLTRNGYDGDRHMIYSTLVSGNTVELRTEMNVDEVEEMDLYYGYGINPDCNIHDKENRALMVFGPIKTA